MKRGKDDDKIVGPMFPRLHVNDTEKGGPRAPPRNKMALYEQLSIPSQRFNTGGLPINPSNSSSWVPTGSSQGSGLERNMAVPSRASPSTSTNLAEKFSTRQLGGVSVKTPSSHIKQRKEVRDDDNFTVPVFVESKTDQQHDKTKNGFHRKKLTPLITTSLGHRIKPQNIGEKDRSRSSVSGVNLRNNVRNQNEKSLKVCSKREPKVKLKTAADLSTREKIDGDVEGVNVSLDEDCGEHPAIIRLHESDACSLQEFKAGSEPADNRCTNGADLMRGIGEEILPRQRSMSYSEGNQSVPYATDYDSQCRGDQAFGSLQCTNGDKSDDASETSMVDSVSGMDISPDDVVGIIGQKCYWKARKAISNQQRIFALQVFELHRLIKVQRLIAGSPYILFEDAAYLSKPSFEGSPAKLPSEFIIKPLPHSKHKDDSEKPSHKMECSAENAVGRTSLSSVKNCSQPSNCGPFIGNPPPALVNGDNKINPWCFPQPGHQWLVPVMSPSEGLIYKPYPGPGFMGSSCGGCGPFGQAPMVASFMTSPFGVHAPHQGIGVLPGAPPVGHSYSPYGMPIMNPAVSGSAGEQLNQFASPGSHAHSGQVSGGGASSNMQHRSSCNLPKSKDGAISHVSKFQTSKNTELQGSTASGPGENAQRDRTNSVAEGQNGLPSSIPEGASQLRETNQTRAIKVVPHNPRSATESTARIFLSIQKERKQHHAV